MTRCTESHRHFFKIRPQHHSIKTQNTTSWKELMSPLSHLESYMMGEEMQATSGRPSCSQLKWKKMMPSVIKCPDAQAARHSSHVGHLIILYIIHIWGIENGTALPGRFPGAPSLLVRVRFLYSPTPHPSELSKDLAAWAQLWGSWLVTQYLASIELSIKRATTPLSWQQQPRAVPRQGWDCNLFPISWWPSTTEEVPEVWSFENY